MSADEIGPPDVKVDISDVLLHIKITPPGGPGNKIMSDLYDFSYQILYWKNSSDNEVWSRQVLKTVHAICYDINTTFKFSSRSLFSEEARTWCASHAACLFACFCERFF